MKNEKTEFGPLVNNQMRFKLWPCLLLFLLVAAFEQPVQAKGPTKRPLVLVHYMPWFSAKPASSRWGWHWTMNHFQPDDIHDGRRSIASKFYPLIGPYDSGDAATLEYHVLQMKLAGIDGVIVDWYGLTDLYDYAMLHRNTQKLIEHLERHDLKFVICYEDQTVPALEKANRLVADQRVEHVRSELNWLQENWFQRRSYLKLQGQPVLLSFGYGGLSDTEWETVLSSSKQKLAYFSEHHRRPCAMGAFDWPVPQQGLSHLDTFEKSANEWGIAIPVVYPRFVDIYEEAKIHESWGRIDDQKGKVFKQTLERALKSEQPIIQLATWNDWGEGTNIEPSLEFGYRDLELVQNWRRESDRSFKTNPADLKIPVRLWKARQQANSEQQHKQCDRIAKLISDGNTAAAKAVLDVMQVE